MILRHPGVLANLAMVLFCIAASGGAPPTTNLMVIDTAAFDTATHRFAVTWHLDTTVVPPGCEGAFVALAGASGTIPTSPPDPDHPFPITALAGDTSFDWEPLFFDTTYRIGIRLRLEGTWTTPDTSQLESVAVPKTSWNPIQLFTTAVKDTLYLLNNRVLLWRDGSYASGTQLHTDTVRSYQPAAGRLKGFRTAGAGFRFVDPVPLPSLYIGFRLDSLTTASMRYRIFRDSGSLFLNEHATVVDTARRLLYLKTDRLDLPFLVLADTMPPRVTVPPDTGRRLDAKPFDFSFTIKDNSANCHWNIFCGNAGDAPFSREPSFSGILHDTTGKVTCQLSTTGALESGLRVYLTLDDGTGADTINYSFTVARSRCDEMTTVADMIMPVAPTSTLDSAACRYALRALFKKAGDRYAPSVFRIYKWAPALSGSREDGWLEYSGSVASRFTFLPGTLFWLITNSETAIDFGNGRSPSLKDTLSISLPPGQWTDFSSPYSFPVAMREVLASTDTAAVHLHCHQWIKDAAHRTWSATPLFSGDVPGLNNKDIALPSGTNGYFTIYNPSDTTVLLRIPPVAAAASTTKKKQQAVPSGDWSIRFDLVQGHSVTGSALCAASSAIGTPIAIPPAPSLSGQSITVSSPVIHRLNGTLVLPAAPSALLTFELTITNNEGSAKNLTCTPTPITGQTEGTIAQGASVQPLSVPVTMSLGAHESRTLVCTIGAAAPGTTPSLPTGASSPPGIISVSRLTPGSGALLVRFTAPAHRHRLEMFDLNGHRYTATPSKPGIAANEYTAVIRSGGTAYGCFLFLLTTFNDDGSSERSIQKKILLPQ